MSVAFHYYSPISSLRTTNLGILTFTNLLCVLCMAHLSNAALIMPRYSAFCAFLAFRYPPTEDDTSLLNAFIILVTGLVNSAIAYHRLKAGLGPLEMPMTAALLFAGCINIATSSLIMRAHRSHIRCQTTLDQRAALDKKIEEGAGGKGNGGKHNWMPVTSVRPI